MYPIDLLPSPLHLVNDAFWLLRSFQATRRASPEAQPSPSDFDVNIRTNTGFLPPSPLPTLRGPYEIWETALEDAQGLLKLGDTLFGAPAEERRCFVHELDRCQSFPRMY